MGLMKSSYVSIILYTFIHLPVSLCIEYEPSYNLNRFTDDDPSLKALNAEEVWGHKEDVIEVEATVSRDSLELLVQGHTVIRHINERIFIVSVNSSVWVHMGVHLVVLHHHDGRLLLQKQFHTWQPGAANELARVITTIQPGRLVLLLAPAEWRPHMTTNALRAISKLGVKWPEDICFGEMWAAMVLTGQTPKVLMEEVTIVRNSNEKLKKPKMIASPLHLHFYIPKGPPDLGCPWYSSRPWLRRLCEGWEGYDDMCRCQDPQVPTPNLKDSNSTVKELIPVVIVTGKGGPSVVRLLFELWSQPLGALTPILIAVDGLKKEPHILLNALHEEFTYKKQQVKKERLSSISRSQFSQYLQISFHTNPAPIGLSGRINEHIRFALRTAFDRFPVADKVIVLEDDLQLAPDFLRYFQQTAPILDSDPRIMVVNAYSFNGWQGEAINSERLFLVTMYPCYGWMTSRIWKDRMLQFWPETIMSNQVDWDWYVRKYLGSPEGSLAVAPEVSRTKHRGGGGGMHVTGWEQVQVLDHHSLNDIPNVTLNVWPVLNGHYEGYLQKTIQEAHLLVMTENPCLWQYVPQYKVGNFVVYFHIEDDKGHDESLQFLHSCLNGNERAPQEHYQLVYTWGYYGNVIYTVACPYSPYCDISSDDYDRLVYKPKPEDFYTATTYVRSRRPMPPGIHQVRVPPESPEEEYHLENYLIFET